VTHRLRIRILDVDVNIAAVDIATDGSSGQPNVLLRTLRHTPVRSASARHIDQLFMKCDAGRTSRGRLDAYPATIDFSIADFEK
jgi:hypothetical protein